MSKLNEAIQSIPLYPSFNDSPAADPVDADIVRRQHLARGG